MLFSSIIYGNQETKRWDTTDLICEVNGLTQQSPTTILTQSNRESFN